MNSDLKTRIVELEAENQRQAKLAKAVLVEVRESRGRAEARAEKAEAENAKLRDVVIEYMLGHGVDSVCTTLPCGTCARASAVLENQNEKPKDAQRYILKLREAE